MDKHYYVYILASQKNGTLYVGVTSNLIKRVWEHKENVVKGFTARYYVHNLVYYEQYDDIRNAIQREKYLKGKKRQFKVDLIKKNNKEWRDLYEDIL